MTPDEVAAYIAAVRWQFAKTMPDWPHEYTVKSWNPKQAAKFEAFCQYIEDHGAIEPWPPPPAQPIYYNRYLVVGDHKYWAMGPQGDSDAVPEKTVINRQARTPGTGNPAAQASPAPEHRTVVRRNLRAGQ